MAVYFDHNATTPLDERVLERMLPWLRTTHGNAASVHRYGRRARAALDQAREQVAALVNVHASQIIFTSGGTESNNFVVKGIAQLYQTGHMALSPIEHPCLLEAAKSLQGWQIDWLLVNNTGQVELNALHPDTRFVSVMLANNETGVLQDVPHIGAIAKRYNSMMHSDASQAAGKIPIDFNALGVNLLTLSAHKFNGPQGVGAVVTDKMLALPPLLHGGGQEKGLRSGTENIAAIVGFGAAAEFAYDELTQRQTHWQQLRNHLEAGLRALDGIHIVAAGAPRLANTVMFTTTGTTGEALLMQLDQAGFAVSSGSACHSEKTDPSHVLLAMGISADTALSAIRVSFGMDNHIDEVDRFLTVLQQQIQEMQSTAVLLGVA